MIAFIEVVHVEHVGEEFNDQLFDEEDEQEADTSEHLDERIAQRPAIVRCEFIQAVAATGQFLPEVCFIELP